MFGRSIVQLLMLIMLPALASADEGLLSLKDLEQEALRNNPLILMFEKKAENAIEKKSLASALPDPMIGFMVQNVGAPGVWSVGKEDMSMQGVVFSQEVPFPGKLGTRGRAAGMQAAQMQEGAREMKLRVLNSLRSAYYEYYLAWRSAEILDRTKELMKNLQHIAETRYATGQGTQQDVIRAQLEVSMLLDRIAEQEQKKETTASQINSLLGRDPMAALVRPADLAPVTPALTRDELVSRALAHAPALQGKRDMVEQSREDLSLSKKEFLPDMVVSGGWFTRGDKTDVWQASVMFRVPLYFWNKSTGVRAAEADLNAAKHDLDAEKLGTLQRVRDLYSAMRTAEHHLHLYGTGIIPQTRLALQSATSNYQVGKTDFTALLESENMLLKYQLMEQEELVNLNKTASMLAEITGETHE